MPTKTKVAVKAVSKTRPEVFIIESLDVEDEDARKEGEVLSRTLRMAGKNPIYHYIRTRKELERFAHAFDKSRYRYLHLSCHGNKDQICLTFDRLSIDDFANVLGPLLSGKRLFVSACLVTTEKLAQAVFREGTCVSVAGPASKIGFDDSAVFWAAFYQLMFKREGARMMRKHIISSLMILGWAFTEQFRFFWPKKSRLPESALLPSDSVLNKRIERLLND